jgi:hypothetical protein
MLQKLNQKNHSEKTNRPLLNVRREDILYREDITTSFTYALFGITVSLAIAGAIYTVGRKLINLPLNYA